MDAAASEPPDLIRKMAEYAGITESFRNYQNNVLFLVADGRPQRVEGSGPPAQAFQQVWDQCEEHSATALRRLQLSFYGSSKSHADSLAAVGLAIPQMGQADFGITLQLTIQFDPPPGEQFVLNFQGKWDRYTWAVDSPESATTYKCCSRIIERCAAGIPGSAEKTALGTSVTVQVAAPTLFTTSARKMSTG
jgi:hypothetical protein